MMSKPHEILGVAPGATLVELRRALREKARHFHPDVNPAAADYFSKVTAAYETLIAEAEGSRSAANATPVPSQISQGSALTLRPSRKANERGLGAALFTGVGLLVVAAAASRWAPYDSSVGRNRDRHTGKFRRGYLA